MTTSEQTKAEVLGALNKFMETYQKRDIDGLMSIIPPDDDLFLFGTGVDEKRTGRAEFGYQVERDWAQTEALAFNLTWQRVSASGPVAWVAAEGLGQGRVGGQAFQFPLRMTAVFEKKNDEWLMRQSHISLPAPGQEEGDSVPV